MPTERCLELVDPETFAQDALDKKASCFVVHVAALALASIHASRTANIGTISTEDNIKLPPEYSDYAKVFSAEEANKLPEHTADDHKIILEDNTTPPHGPIYSLGATELETLRAYIETNLSNGFIRPSTLLAGAPLVGKALDRLSRAKRYTQLDLTNAYYCVRIAKGDEWKTAFRTRYGHYEYQVMPFGLSNAPAIFQGLINRILAEKLNIFCIVYLDDILIEMPISPRRSPFPWLHHFSRRRSHGARAHLECSRLAQATGCP